MTNKRFFAWNYLNGILFNYFPKFSLFYNILFNKIVIPRNSSNLIRDRFCINQCFNLKQYTSRNSSAKTHQNSSKSHHCDFCGFLRFLWISVDFMEFYWNSVDFFDFCGSVSEPSFMSLVSQHPMSHLQQVPLAVAITIPTAIAKK